MKTLIVTLITAVLIIGNAHAGDFTSPGCRFDGAGEIMHVPCRVQETWRSATKHCKTPDMLLNGESVNQCVARILSAKGVTEMKISLAILALAAFDRRGQRGRYLSVSFAGGLPL